MSIMLKAALEYANRGWYVFPISPGTKIPFPGTHGFLDATINPQIIEQWWSASPDANIGLSLEPSGLYVLDVDVAKEKKGKESLAELDKDLPTSLTQRSARGGLHVFYAANGYPPLRMTNFAPGLDLFGSGYMLIAPSRLTGAAFAGAPTYATGLYVWHEPQDPIQPLPPVLAAVLRKTAPAAKSRPPGDVHGPTLDPLPEGGRNTSLYRLATALRDQGLSRDAIDAALNISNLERCKPPLNKHEVGLIASSAAKNTPTRDVAGNAVFVQDILDEVVLPSGFEQALQQARKDVQNALGYIEHSVATPLYMSGLDMLAMEVPPTPWLVRGLITEGGTVVVGGEPKTSKTWLLCELAVAIATGTPFLNQFITGDPKIVTYFFAEDDLNSVKNRLVSICRGRGMDPAIAMKNIYPQPRGRFIDLTRDEDLALIVASCRMIGHVDVAILEPLRDIHTGEEDSSDSMGPLFRRIRCIGELLHATPMVAHHMRKPDNEKRETTPGTKLRGSNAIHGSVDSGIYLSDLRETTDGGTLTVFTNTIQSQVKGAKGAGTFDVNLTIEDGEQRTAIQAKWTTDVAKDINEIIKEKILSAIRTTPRNDPLHKSQIAKIVGGNRENVMNIIDQLSDTGQLIRTFRHPKGHELSYAVFLEAPPIGRPTTE